MSPPSTFSKKSKKNTKHFIFPPILNNYKSIIILFLFSIVSFAYISTIWSNFRLSVKTISDIFGYLDYQNNWQGLDNFVKLRIPYKDFYYEYGYLFLVIQSVGYLLTGQTFLSVLISRNLYLPILSVIISFIIAKKVIKKPIPILIFMILCLFYGSNNDYISIRHLIAELSLAYFFYYLNKKYISIKAGIIAGIAFLTALEYGIALNLTIICVFFLNVIWHRNKNNKINIYIKKFFQGELLVLIPFFIWLAIKGGLFNFIFFMNGFMDGFYQNSPCSGSFPRIDDIYRPSDINLFSIPISFIQRINLYIIPITYLIIILSIILKNIFIKKIPKTNQQLIITFSIFGLLIYSRVFLTPCLDYLSYGLIPLFLVLTMLTKDIFLKGSIEKQTKTNILKKLLVILIIVWFVISQPKEYFSQFLSQKPSSIPINNITPRKFYAPAGWYLLESLTNAYSETEKYIQDNTSVNDYIYVYPWGPYFNILNKQSPIAITNKYQFIAGEDFIISAVEELQKKSPKLIIINNYNNLGVAHFGRSRGDVPRFYAISYEDGPVFNGYGNPLEQYILENYSVVFHNQVSIVLKPRPYPISVRRKTQEIFRYDQKNNNKCDIDMSSLTPSGIDNQYRITNHNASLIFHCPENIPTDIEITIKMDLNILEKYLTKHHLKFYLNSDKNSPEQAIFLEELANGKWQKIKIPVTRPIPINYIEIKISENYGFLWWLHPRNISVESVKYLKEI